MLRFIAEIEVQERGEWHEDHSYARTVTCYRYTHYDQAWVWQLRTGNKEWRWKIVDLVSAPPLEGVEHTLEEAKRQVEIRVRALKSDSSTLNAGAR